MRYILFIVYLIIALLFVSSLSAPTFDTKAEYQGGIKTVSNPERPVQGEKRFTILDKKVLDRKFFLIQVDTDSENNLFVLDTKEKKIYKFNKDGVFQRIIESRMFVEPDFLLVDSNDKVYVRDRRSLHIFSSDGNYDRSVVFPFFIGEYAITGKNLVIIENSYWQSGKKYWRLELYDLNGNQMKTLFQHHEGVPKGGLTYTSRFHPRLLVRQNKNSTLFAFTGDYKLNLIDENGDIMSIIKKEEKPQPLANKDIKQMKAADASVWVPEHRPLFYDVYICDEGNIYVEKWPDSDPWKSRYFDYFDREGRFLYIINQFPPVILKKIQKDRLFSADPLKGSPYLKLSILRYSLGE